jgi:hypothetical protein
MTARSEMQFNLSILERPLPGIESELVQGFDGILDIRFHIPGLVHGPVSTNTKDFSQLKTASKNLA